MTYTIVYNIYTLNTYLYTKNFSSVGSWNQRRPTHLPLLYCTRFIIHLYLEAINVLLKCKHQIHNCIQYIYIKYKLVYSKYIYI